MPKYNQPIAESLLLVSFFDAFFAESDKRPPAGDDDPYVAFFTRDARVVIGSQEVTGLEQIAELRLKMWRNIASRQHELAEAALVSETEAFLTGSLECGLVNGAVVMIDWAAKMEFADMSWSRLQYYRVYVDYAPIVKALAS